MNLRLSVIAAGALVKGKKGQQAFLANMDAFVTEATMFLTGAIKKYTPRRSGNLGISIIPDVLGKGTPIVKGVIATVTPYALPVETGTGVHGPKGQPITILPKNGQALFWPGAKHPVKKVVIQGMKGAHMFEHGFAENIPALESMANKYGLQIVQELSK